MVHTEHPTYPSQAYPFQVELESLFSKGGVMTVVPMLLGEVALALLASEALVAAFVVQTCFDH
jgi:hypothetical protein